MHEDRADPERPTSHPLSDPRSSRPGFGIVDAEGQFDLHVHKLNRAGWHDLSEGPEALEYLLNPIAAPTTLLHGAIGVLNF